MRTREQKYELFRSLHQRPGLFILPNPWDAGSAKILTALGFEALATTSAGYAFSVGLPDSAAAITREALLENARSIADGTELPVSADLQNGFGSSPDTCAETILLAAKIGLVGGSIEDATGDPQNPIYELNHAIDRIAAAAEAAHDSHFFLTARAENFLYGHDDLDDTIRRLQAFAEAGADVLYAPGLPDLEAIKKVCAAVPKPVNVLMGLKGATYSVEQLAAAGVKRVSVGGSFARAALGALVRAALEVKNHGTFTYANETLPHADATAFMSRSKPL
jgi:2-methylisocitrate lyase-like PEP mutase family enzyme